MRTLARLLLLGFASLCVARSAMPAGETPLRIGIPETFFYDMSDALIHETTDPFADVLRETSGLRGEPITGEGPFAVTQKLDTGKFQLAVLHGFEYAWVRQKYADLTPILIAVRSGQDQRAFIVVKKDNPAAGLADLKGKDLSLPKRTKAHSRLYLERLCAREGAKRPEDYFGRIVRSTDVETALDDLARGKFAATLVDASGMDFYKDLKPGVFDRFKVLVQSGTFPPLVVATKKGALSDATIKRIYDGLRAAAKTSSGREMMKMWRITSFEPVPANFNETLAASLKAYPPPAQEK